MARPPAPAYARTRARPRRRRHGRLTAILLLLGTAFLVVVALAAFGSSPSAPEAPLSLSGVRAGPPTPEVIATQGEQGDQNERLDLFLPVVKERVTAIGYHAAGEDALPLDPVGHQKNVGLFTRVFHRIFGGGSSGIGWYQLGGGQGPGTGAVDVGAAVGTEVYAPVTGTIVGIRDYVLNGRPFGNIVQIQPSRTPDRVVTLTHLGVDPALSVGSPVLAGKSPTLIGTIVDFSAVEEQSLARYTNDAGNHVTIEVTPAASGR